jgi:hypothetical protein
MSNHGDAPKLVCPLCAKVGVASLTRRHGMMMCQDCSAEIAPSMDELDPDSAPGGFDDRRDNPEFYGRELPEDDWRLDR